MNPNTPLSNRPPIAGSSVWRLLADGQIRLYPLLAVSAVLAILLPAHPSLQSVLIMYGIPSPVISVLFAAPVLYAVLVKRIFTYKNMAIILPFLAYIAWMLVRTIGSPALGQENTFSSLRGMFILTPLALLCALVGAMSSLHAVKTIRVLGLFAIIHFCLLHFTGVSLDESVGFRSLSSDSENENYQSTSFYVGIFGVLMLSVFIRGQRRGAFWGGTGLFLTLIVMGAIGARASVVGLLVSSLVLILIAGSVRVILYALIFGLLGIIVTILGFTLGHFDFEVVVRYFTAIDRFSLLLEGGDPSHRLYLFLMAFQMWTESLSNFIFGAGVGTFPWFIGQTESGWYPHNFILESLAEGGLVAGLLLLWICIDFVAKLFRVGSKNAAREDVYFGALAVFALISYQFMGGLQTLWIPAFFVALFLFSQARQKT